MIRLFLIILLLLPVRVHGMQMIGFGAAGGSCATQTTDQSQSTSDQYQEIYNVVSVGQSFVAGITGSVYSITIRGIAYSWGTGGQITARFGTTADLSGSYLGQTIAQDIIYDDANHTYELLFPEGSRPSQTASNTYYVSIANSATSIDDALYVFINTAGGYASGKYYYSETTRHNLSGYVDDWDLRFTVKVCD